MTADPVLGELLSAYLDGELDDTERAEVDRRIATDLAARQELDELSSVRSAVRGLPEVEPRRPVVVPSSASDGAGGSVVSGPGPEAAVVLDLSERRRRRTRWSLAAGAAAAAIVVVGLVALGGDDAGDPMVPPMTEFASRHEMMVELVASGATEVPEMPGDFEPMDPARMGDEAPAELPSGFERMAGFESPDGTMHVVYTHDDMAVSVYRQEGTVDWAALPADGTAMEMEGDPAWLHTTETPIGTEEIMVLQQGDTVYTFVAAVPHDAMVAVVEGVAFN